MNSVRDFSIWPEDGKVVPVGDADITLDDAEHPLCLAHAPDIAANWTLESAANPALFNGRMLLHRDLRLEGNGRLSGRAHLVPYAALLWWRKQAPRPALGEHLFPVAVPVTADGAVLAIEMASHTANAGRVYCAAGSLDASDLDGGKVDLAGNMAREVREETGLDLSTAVDTSGWHALRINRAVTLFRVFRLAFDADEAVQHVLGHMAEDHEKEIARPVIIRPDDGAKRNLAPFMLPILDLIFSPESSLIPGRQRG